MIQKICLLLLFICLCSPALAQEPAHFTIGASELSDIDIYDVTQDASHNYWLATNNGVIKYDGYEFLAVEVPSMVDKSVFGWTKDANNDLYCYNLSGQIFKIKDGICKEYFKVPDSLVSHVFSFDFNKDGDMIIASRSLLKLNKRKELRVIYSFESIRSFFGLLFKKKDGTLLTQEYLTGNVFMLSDTTTILFDSMAIGKYKIGMLELNDAMVLFDRVSTDKLEFNSGQLQIVKPIVESKKSGLYRLIKTSKYLFATLPTGGFQLYDHSLFPEFKSKILFENELISAVYEDHEGNIVLGTFKGGLYVIPQMELSDIKIPISEPRLTVISGSADRLFIGTQGGDVYQLNKETDKVSLFRKGESKSVERLQYIPETDELLVDNLPTKLINISSLKEEVISLGSIKDIEKVDNAYAISSNVGILIYDYQGRFDFKRSSLAFLRISERFYQLLDFGERTYCVNFDATNQIMYAGTSTGLKINKGNQFNYFKLAGKQLNCTDIKSINNEFFVATQNEGILIFKNGQLIGQWKADNSQLLSNSIYALQFYQDKLYIATEKGFQIFDQQGSLVATYGIADGLYSNKLIDFLVQANQIWFMGQKTLQKLTMEELEVSPFKPQLTLAMVLQEGDTLDSSKDDQNFNADQSKFEFYLKATTLRYQNDITYQYQLTGIDTDWQVNNYKDNKVSYVSLPPGQYVFKAKAVCRNVESELVTYSFVIKPPFYYTWWFYMLSVLVVALVSGSIFSFFYWRQKQEIEFQNELNESKLSAIQSQMNPHFIFNALNSIQDFIVLNEKRLAGRYLGKFADLMRIYLNHSQVKTVSLQEEIDALSLYLELENLRFEALIFSIEVDTQLDRHTIAIPSLIIQPYVENALKHGLLHKNGEKQLSIYFKYDEQNDLLICEITDNGIGRAASSEINKMRDPKHQSFATKATRNRLELLNYGSDKPLSAVIIDLVDDNNASTGTKVILTIPIID